MSRNLIFVSILLLASASAIAEPGPIYNLTADSVESSTGQMNGFQLAMDAAKRIHTVYRDDHLVRGIQEAYYRRFNGTTWDAPKRLSNLAATVHLSALEKLDVAGPVITASPTGDVHVVWNYAIVSSIFPGSGGPRKIFYQRSTNGGASFSKPVLIGEGGDRFGGATICSGAGESGKRVNIISRDTSGRELVAYHSFDNGVRFNQTTIAEYDSAKEGPVCAFDTYGASYVVWQDDRDGIVVDGLRRRDIHFSRSADGGANWDTERNLSNTPAAGSSDASIAVDTQGRVHVAYHDDRYDGNESWEIYYAQSLDLGRTWKAPLKLTTTQQNQQINIDVPTVATTSDGMIHIAWQDNRNGYLQIYSMSGDGRTWSQETAVSGTTRSALAPSLASSPDGTWLGVLWSAYEVQNKPRGPVVKSTRDIFLRTLR